MASKNKSVLQQYRPPAPGAPKLAPKKKTLTKGRMGRPPVVTPEVTEAILHGIGELGLTQAAACKRAGISIVPWWEKVKADKDLANRLARARECGVDVNLQKARTALESVLKTDSSPAVSAANNLAHFHKWVAAKHHRALYGERVEMGIDGTVHVTLTNDEVEL